MKFKLLIPFLVIYSMSALSNPTTTPRIFNCGHQGHGLRGCNDTENGPAMTLSLISVAIIFLSTSTPVQITAALSSTFIVSNADENENIKFELAESAIEFISDDDNEIEDYSLLVDFKNMLIENSDLIESDLKKTGLEKNIKINNLNDHQIALIAYEYASNLE